MRAGQRVAGDAQGAAAGDAARRVPAARGDQAIERQGLERGAGSGQGARRLGEMGGGEQAAGWLVQHQDAGLGRKAGRMGRGRLPG